MLPVRPVHPAVPLPRRAPISLLPDESGGSAEPAARPARQRSEHLIRPIDILIVEDSPDMRRTVATVLIAEGYEVLSAADGVDALRVLEHTDPWLLVLDLQLPRMDGQGLIQEIRQRRIRIRIVIMTGTQDARQAARDLQADDFLAKPFDIDDLTRIAERYRPRSE